MNRARPVYRPDPRSAAASLLSFIFPGLGQAYNGRWALAALLAIPVLLFIGLAVLVIAIEGRGALGRLLDTRILVALLTLDAALLAWRLVAIIQAHGERGRLALAAWPTWVTGALVLLTISMHAVPAWYASKVMDTLGRVSLEGGGQLLDKGMGRDVEVPAPSEQPELGERITVLLVGVDFARGRDHHLTDTMLVATLDPGTDQAAMISVPRDLYGVPLGDGRVYNDKLNSLMARANADPVTYPNGGPGTLKAAIAALLDTRIHYFAAIDMDGMRQLIDAVGGVDVVVGRTIDDTGYRDPATGVRGFYIDAGPHHLDGETAMAYVRSRKAPGESDFTRAERQQQVLAAIAEKLTAGNLLVTLPDLLDTVRDNVATDIPGRRIPELAAAGQDADLSNTERVVLTPDDGYVWVEPASAAGYILHANLDAIHALGDRIFHSATDTGP